MLLRHAGFRRLCQARERILDLGDETVSVDALAREASLSPSHFIRQFEAVFGLTRISCVFARASTPPGGCWRRVH